jgi:hypothetical protein
LTAPAESTTENTPAEGAESAAAAATEAPATESATEAGKPAEGRTRRSLEDTLASLPEADKAFVLDAVRNARSEAKNLRDRAKSADDVRSELASTIAKALGIEQDTPPDPAVLAQQLNEQTTAARQASVELAVYRAATSVGGDPAALLDSVSFVRSLGDVDPTDTNAIAEKVKSAVTANPALGVAPVRRAPALNPAAGMSESGAPGLADQIDAAKKAGDWARVIHLENQKLVSAPR